MYYALINYYYGHNFIIILKSSQVQTLNEADVELLKPVCKALNIPVQSPVHVEFHKRLHKEDTITGRLVDYSSLTNTVDLPTSSSAFVSVKSQTEFGHIERFFCYRSTKFVILSMFDNFTHTSDGLIIIADSTAKTRTFLSFDSVSRPLVVASDPIDNQLWILNPHFC